MPAQVKRESEAEKRAREAREEAERQQALRDAERGSEGGEGAATGDQGPRDPDTVANPEIDLSRCDVISEKGKRRCILARDHDGAHQFRKGGARKEYKPVTGELLFEDVPENEHVEGVREEARDELQQAIDERVKQAYQAWLDAGKPAEFNKAGSARKRILFEPGNAETIRYKLDKAGRLIGKTVRTVGPKTHTDGHQMFYYIVRDKQVREKKSEEDS